MKISEILCEDVDLLNEGPKLDAMKRAAKSVGRGIGNVATGAVGTASGLPGAAVGGLVRGYKQARAGKSFFEPDTTAQQPVQQPQAAEPKQTSSEKRRASRYGSPERYNQPVDAEQPQAATQTAQSKKTGSAMTQIKKQVSQMSLADQQKLVKYLQTQLAKAAAQAGATAQQAPNAAPQQPQATAQSAPKARTAPAQQPATNRKQPARKAPVKKPVSV